MAQEPPSSDLESSASDGAREYQYESDGEERLGEGARRLYREAGGSYRRKFSPKMFFCAGLSRHLSRARCVARIHQVRDFYPMSQPSHLTVSHRDDVVYLPPRHSGTTRTRVSGRPADEPTRTGLATPPPTCVAPCHPPEAQPPMNARREHDERPPAPCDKPQTLLYPLLVETETRGYFRSDDGVSNRTTDGERKSLSDH